MVPNEFKLAAFLLLITKTMLSAYKTITTLVKIWLENLLKNKYICK